MSPGFEFSVTQLIIKALCTRNCDEGRNEREKHEEGIDDTKTAIPTFRPCMALPGHIKEYRVCTFLREAW